MRLAVGTLLMFATAPAVADFPFRFGDAVVATGDGAGTGVRQAVR